MGITSDECVGPLCSLNPTNLVIGYKIMLFMGEDYYAIGGWEDFQGYYDTVEEAKLDTSLIESNPTMQWAHIVENGKITWQARDGRRVICPGNTEGYWIWEEVKQCET